MMNLAGFPVHTSLEGMFFVTTEPAPITHPFDSVTPAIIVQLPPITTSFSICTGDHSPPDGGYLSFVITEPGPMKTLFPIMVLSEI